VNDITYSRRYVIKTTKERASLGLIASLMDVKGKNVDSRNKKIKGGNNDGNGHSDNNELEKAKSHIIVEIIEYISNSVVSKTIIKKSTGNISVMSFDSGEGLTEKTSPFDTFAQIIEGKAEIVIDKISHLLVSGQGIIIPAHSPNFIKPNCRFKMILTIIKSGYE
jgi:quercetin dioxygenase-like cupin family protein